MSGRARFQGTCTCRWSGSNHPTETAARVDAHFHVAIDEANGLMHLPEVSRYPLPRLGVTA